MRLSGADCTPTNDIVIIQKAYKADFHYSEVDEGGDTYTHLYFLDLLDGQVFFLGFSFLNQ